MNEVWKKPPISLEAYQKMVGHKVGVSSWHLIDQKRIDVYADVIEDHQFIHVDPERAKRETSYGTTVAHGFLTMSLMSIMSYEVMPVIEGTTMGVNYGFDKLRFISPSSVSVERRVGENPSLGGDLVGFIFFCLPPPLHARASPGNPSLIKN